MVDMVDAVDMVDMVDMVDAVDMVAAVRTSLAGARSSNFSLLYVPQASACRTARLEKSAFICVICG